MSHDAHSAHGKDHAPHVLPLKTYILTWVALIVLTVLTVAASYFNFGTWNVVIALLVATTKATIVALLFMHLKYDLRFHAIIFSFSLVVLFVFIAFTMYDTETRGRADAKQSDRPADPTNPYAESKQDLKLKAKYSEGEVKWEKRKEEIKVRDVPPPQQPPR